MSRMDLASLAGGPPEPTAPVPSPPRDRVVRDLHGGIAVRLTESAGHTRAVVTGEIDLVSATTLRDVLGDILHCAPGRLEVDLGGVGFFDCSGLNVLLRLRARAREHGVELVVTAASPAVARLLEITGTNGAVTAAP
ncbi:STAS domain-containing protein [Streptomyces sp. V4-01]|uniref:Anti-sigma factor antagonist n=1 Tax=Actinacidiphila polyblastidii TaxID=3110430 RepID=A0ABU7P9J7_9ACTN|nr:STAS domain-containing protein [Streptomyces sp. V4-01]